MNFMANEVKIKFLENSKSMYDFKKATAGSAGFDLIASIKTNITIKPSKSKLIKCGISII